MTPTRRPCYYVQAIKENPVEYPTLPYGMRKPGDFSLIGDDWSRGELKLADHTIRGTTRYTPDLVHIGPRGAAVLSARYINGMWITGALQLNKPQRGRGLWSFMISSGKANAVPAVFLYCHRTKTELDMEYIRKGGVRGWAFTAHMPLLGGSGKKSFGGGFFPYSQQDFYTPRMHSISINDDEARFFIGGARVFTIPRSMMPSDCRWTTDSQMEMFASIEYHGAWSNTTPADYAQDSGLTVWGLRTPN